MTAIQFLSRSPGLSSSASNERKVTAVSIPRNFQFAAFSLVSFLCGCASITPHDRPSLLDPHIERSEVIGLLAGFGTTFAALPDLIQMLRRRSSAGINPKMAAIMGAFQILWIFYGLLIASRPVVLWNIIAVCVNFLNVGAYFYFVSKEKARGNS
jgi:MtN3 and saliva related transmembrane protein